MSMAISSMGAGAPRIMSGASPRKSATQKMSDLFQKIDSAGTGSITKTQFEQAFQNANPPPAFKAMGADAIFDKLDPNGTGSIAKQDFVDGMKSIMKEIHQQHRQHHQVAGNGSWIAPTPAQTLANSMNALNSLGTPPPVLGPSGSNIDLSV